MYASLKTYNALFEAMAMTSLEILQSRLLLTVFEIGHAMYPSAYISAVANIRAAISLGINATYEDLSKVFQDPLKVGEAQQTWRGIVITDRSDMAPQHTHQMVFVLNQELVVDMSRWKMANYLILKVVNPYQHAMLETLELGSRMNIPDNEYCISTSLNILSSLVHEIARGAEISPPVEIMTLSVFLSHCIYKAAMVCLGDARVSGCVDPEPSIRPLKDILGYLGMRWVAAKRYLEKLETLQENM
ncbi:uncharacterized protein PGRI_033990 [Penicillium griseofulvum]|uniref:Transcription factor n=1 Tax=Penicillium patulum TaxID=5078 RepID=A0A135L9I0_PENPA|nr:uncharacterized protein PGRI_033990 [Penicillium griseofulvum]KXG45632.1 hypothetical protein PGRI_033990 [Penicillium griseofulvum]